MWAFRLEASTPAPPPPVVPVGRGFVAPRRLTHLDGLLARLQQRPAPGHVAPNPRLLEVSLQMAAGGALEVHQRVVEGGSSLPAPAPCAPAASASGRPDRCLPPHS